MSLLFYFYDMEIFWESGTKVNYKVHKRLFPILCAFALTE